MGNQIAVEKKPFQLDSILKGAPGGQLQHNKREWDGGGGEPNCGRKGGCHYYDSSIHLWRFFIASEDPHGAVQIEAVSFSEQELASFDKTQVYLLIHIYLKNLTARGIKMNANGDEPPHDVSLLNEARDQPSGTTTTKATLESLLASSAETLTPRGLASPLPDAFTLPESKLVASEDEGGEGDAVTGNPNGSSVCESEEGEGPLDFDMYVWRGKESPRDAQAVAVAKSFELEKVLKADWKKTLWMLFRGGEKVSLSSVFSTRLARRSDTDGEEDDEDEDDDDSEDEEDRGDSDDNETEKELCLKNHLYNQLQKRRRLKRKDAGEAGESPCSSASRCNGSAPKSSLLRIKNIFQTLPPSQPGRAVSTDALSMIITNARQDLSSTTTTTAAETNPEDLRSSGKRSSSRTAKQASATVPSPSNPPPSPKQIRAKFSLPLTSSLKTESMSKSGLLPVVGFKLADLQALQERELEGDLFSKAEVSLRSEKLKKYDTICSKITDQLFLGSQTVSKDIELLQKHGITHILNCAGSICPEYYPNDFTYRTLYLMDGVREDITCMLYDIIEWMENVISSNYKLLVHCQQGVSRSSAMTIGYLMWKRGWDFEKTHMFVKERRGVSSPNAGFICQLLYLSKRLNLTRERPDPETRLYQVVTHTQSDPNFIVAKLAKKENLAHLQNPPTSSPNCYILQSPDAFYIWVGAQCSERFVEIAKQTVHRVQRFEKAANEVNIVKQGRENDEFKRRLGQVNLEELT